MSFPRVGVPPFKNARFWKAAFCLKNLIMPLFLMGCFPTDFQEVKRLLRTKSVKRPIKVGKRPINEGKRLIKANVLVGVSIGCLMGCFRAPPPWRKTASLKRPIKRSMIVNPRPQKRVLFSSFAQRLFVNSRGARRGTRHATEAAAEGLAASTTERDLAEVCARVHHNHARERERERESFVAPKSRK